MGEIKVRIGLKNDGDIYAAKNGYISPDKIRAVEIDATVDTGAVMLYLPEDVVERLGLEAQRKVVVSYADERKEERNVAGTLRIFIGERHMATECIVGPPLCEALIGQIILEELDLIADCKEKTLGPRPESPFLPLLKLK